MPPDPLILSHGYTDGFAAAAEELYRRTPGLPPRALTHISYAARLTRRGRVIDGYRHIRDLTRTDVVAPADSLRFAQTLVALAEGVTVVMPNIEIKLPDTTPERRRFLAALAKNWNMISGDKLNRWTEEIEMTQKRLDAMDAWRRANSALVIGVDGEEA